jgi:hypothetical protein
MKAENFGEFSLYVGEDKSISIIYEDVEYKVGDIIRWGKGLIRNSGMLRIGAYNFIGSSDVAVHLGFYVKAEDESIWTLPEILPFVIF